MKMRSDRDANLPPLEWWNHGAVGMYLHTWGDETQDVVGVVILGPILGGYVPCLVTPYDGGDFYMVIDVTQIIPLTTERKSK